MGDTTAVYEFSMTPGKGAAVGSIVRDAWLKARAFFGDDDFDLDVRVQGRSAQWDVECVATRLVDPEAGR